MVELKNIDVNIKQGNVIDVDSLDLKFAFVDDCDNVSLSNVTISNTKSSNLFYFQDSYGTIIIDRLYLYNGSLIFLYEQDNSEINNINIDGNCELLENSISNSILNNFKLYENSMVMGLDYTFSTNNDFLLENVTFEKFIKPENDTAIYGIITIDTRFDVHIKSCTFGNNSNLVAMVHVRSASYANVIIEDSIFNNNVARDICYNGWDVDNAILINNDSYANVIIKNSIFNSRQESIFCDETANITFINNVFNISSDERVCRFGINVMINGSNSWDDGTISQVRNLETIYMDVCPLSYLSMYNLTYGPARGMNRWFIYNFGRLHT